MWARGVRRWTREGTCEAARAHLGMETQRQGHARARARTPPAQLRRSARLPLSAPRLIAPGAPCGRSPAGYGNARPPWQGARLGPDGSTRARGKGRPAMLGCVTVFGLLLGGSVGAGWVSV